MIRPSLEKQFSPPIESMKKNGDIDITVAIERENNFVLRREFRIPDDIRLAERIIKFMLWSAGGWKIYFSGPANMGEYIRGCYASSGSRAFDVELMSRIYKKPMEVVLTDKANIPQTRQVAAKIGGYFDGCRIGFDLGASDYKVSAVRDGEVLYSDEFPWNPKDQSDPEYHFSHLMDGLRKAAKHLPKVDAIGGSSAGIIVNNEVMVASLFRAVPLSKYHDVQTIFKRVQKEWKVPIEVANDGDVTALAGALTLKTTAVLGIAMGSSLAAGYIDRNGSILGWINELAFVPVDMNEKAAADEWSGDVGVGVQYFSQQAVNKLLGPAGISLPGIDGLPERLKAVQEMMKTGDDKARAIYSSIGTYLGYTIPWYTQYYDYDHLLLLGRVTTGKGGDIVVEEANKILKTEFPEIHKRIKIHVPDEKSRRLGQAVAAASLPKLG